MQPIHETPLPAPLVPGFSMPPLLWGSAGLAAAVPLLDWLWQGYLAPGAVTLLTGQWKEGKTTLASILLSRMKTGGQLAGLPLTAGKAVVVSEEGPDHWQRRHQKLDFGDNVGWYCRPFRGKPRLAEWSAFVDGLAQLFDRQRFALLLIDPLAAFLPGCENHAGSVLEALAPLQRLKAMGLSILALHHPRKGDPPIGQAARGSGALSDYADIVIEMRASGPAADRRRRPGAVDPAKESVGQQTARREVQPGHRQRKCAKDSLHYRKGKPSAFFPICSPRYNTFGQP